MADRHQLDRDNVGWDAWGNHVLSTLDKLEKKVDKLEDKIGKNREETLVEIATLKAKAGVWGSVAGVIASIITSLIVGLLVYQLTQGSVKPVKKIAPPQPTAASVMLPPREDPLAGYHVREEMNT